jgi:transposase
MWIDDSVAIAESEAALLAQERAARGNRSADRLKLLRLLKSGRERSLAGAAAVLGYSARHAQRWWGVYRRGGLAALLSAPRWGGSRERITPAALQALAAEMRAGRIARLEDARAYLRDRWGIAYCLDAISGLFKRHKAKLKTGRPRHRRADAAAQAAFKKSARARACGAPGSPGLRPR